MVTFYTFTLKKIHLHYILMLKYVRIFNFNIFNFITVYDMNK